ncbi:MBL fold metallo-hydrolase, partial [Patescibacteria group bacterium]|nr:MBL fold metallo-hydrolase [Patescibacteria group bacterium]
LLELNGTRILTDPVWSQRTSPVSILGPKRFHPVPIALEDLPKIDIVIISHDHYDHLDMVAVQKLAKRGATFVTALGVGAHLESWDIDPKQIIELDWWDEFKLNDNFTVACCPSQHFSGRSWLGKRNQTLWSTWAIVGPKHRVFFCGDTGEIPEFETIGQKYGPFDLTLMKIGAYSEYWPDIHLTPEQTVNLHQKLQGKLLMPIHWGTFNLAFHSWNEPINRLMIESQKSNINLITPCPGQRINIDSLPRADRWWDKKEPL